MAGVPRALRLRLSSGDAASHAERVRTLRARVVLAADRRTAREALSAGTSGLVVTMERRVARL